MNIKINIPAWYSHEYTNAIKLIQALLRGEDGEKQIAAIKAEIAAANPNWNRVLLEHTETVVSVLESARC